MKRLAVGFGTALALLAGSGLVRAQTTAPGTVDGLVSSAKAAAGLEWAGTFLRLCVVPPPAAPGRARGAAAGPPAKDTWYAEPARVADNFYFIGTKIHSAWALVGSDGIIVLEALFDYAAPDEIAGGLKNARPRHQQGQVHRHLARARRSRRRRAVSAGHDPGAHLVYGGPDWDAIEKSANHSGGKPKRDIAGTDGMKLSVGDASVQIVTTPGHTPGTLSFLFEVKERGMPLRVAYVGGTAIPFNGTARTTTAISRRRPGWPRRPPISAPPCSCRTIPSSTMLSTRRTPPASRKTDQPNPFEVGKTAVGRYFSVVEHCAGAAKLRAAGGR